jgi:hypothetical protein
MWNTGQTLFIFATLALPILADAALLVAFAPTEVLPPFDGFDGAFGFCGAGHEDGKLQQPEA